MNHPHLISELALLTEEVRARHFEQKELRFRTLDLKGKNQLVTDLDVQVEKELVKGLKQIVPDADFLTEEKTTAQEEAASLRWIIDPIDGTTNFVHNIPAYAISIGLEQDGEMVAGVIYELNRKEFYSAGKGQGAFMNGEPIAVASSQTLEDTLVATGFPYFDFTLTERYMKVLEQFMRRTRGVRRLGSAALDLAYVACGKFDAFYEYGLSPWDVAAGCLIVKEAGGTVSDFKGGDDFVYGRSIIASQNNVYNDVLKIINERW